MKFKIGEKRKNSTARFDSILPDILHEYQLEKSFTIEGLSAQWYNIVGDIISTHSKPERIYKKILYVAVDHSVYANEIIMMKDSIVKRINEEFSFSAVNNIKVEVKKITW